MVNCNLDQGRYLIIAPALSASGGAKSTDRWTLSLNAGVGKPFKVGRQAMNSRLKTQA